MDDISANRVTNGNQGTESRYLMIDLLPVAVLAIGEYISLMESDHCRWRAAKIRPKTQINNLLSRHTYPSRQNLCLPSVLYSRNDGEFGSKVSINGQASFYFNLI